jgi:hypothetical protein
MRAAVLIIVAIVALASFGWCRVGFIHVPSLDGFVLTLPADMSDAEIQIRLAEHDAMARKFYADAGAQGH